MLHYTINLLTNWSYFLPLLGCVAIWKPKGIQIARKYLQNSFANNKDGAGFAYAKNGKITVLKGFFSFDEFWKAYEPFQKLACVIHFRIATHGKVNGDNCHPFTMQNNKYALVHNGVMPSSLHSDDKDESDTKQFAEKLERVIEMIPWHHPDFTAFVNEAISYNKVAVMRNDGKVWLFNEKKGEWHKGAWYSNHTYAYSESKRKFSDSTKGFVGLWHQIGYGSEENPIYSSVQRGIGWYDKQGAWHMITADDETDTIEAAEAEVDLGDLSEEELSQLAELGTDELQGDFEFMPETEQERVVQRWLAVQTAKNKHLKLATEGLRKRQTTDAHYTRDDGFPDWEPCRADLPRTGCAAADTHTPRC